MDKLDQTLKNPGFAVAFAFDHLVEASDLTSGGIRTSRCLNRFCLITPGMYARQTNL